MEEPARKSFLDIVKRDLSTTDRSSFLTRLVYIGEYEGAISDSLKIFKNNVKELKEQHGETVSGLLLLYPRFFLHFVEASEETIYRHLLALFSNGSTGFGRVLALPAYYNALKVYFTGWFYARIEQPPLLLDAIEKTELEVVAKHLQNCLWKVFSLCEFLTDSRTDNAENRNESVQSLESIAPHLLPESTVVEYLLSIRSAPLEDVRVYLLKFERVPQINLFNDRVWPPTRDFVPRDPLPSTDELARV